MYISLYDIGLFILFTLSVAVGGLLVAVLRQVLCILGYLREILASHHQEVGQALSLLPETLAHLNELTIGLKETADQTNGAFHDLQDGVADSLNEFRSKMEAFAICVKVIDKILRTVFAKTA